MWLFPHKLSKFQESRNSAWIFNNISHILPWHAHRTPSFSLHARLPIRLEINLTKTYYLCTQEFKLCPGWSKCHYTCHITFYNWAFKPTKNQPYLAGLWSSILKRLVLCIIFIFTLTLPNCGFKHMSRQFSSGPVIILLPKCAVNEATQGAWTLWILMIMAEDILKLPTCQGHGFLSVKSGFKPNIH